MEHECSLPLSQQPATDPYPEPVESSTHLPSYVPQTHSNIIFPYKPTSSEWSLPFRFSALVCISHPSRVLHAPPILLSFISSP